MANIDQLLGRIDAEFSAIKQRAEEYREKSNQGTARFATSF
jgi:hypothetical protein